MIWWRSVSAATGPAEIADADLASSVWQLRDGQHYVVQQNSDPQHMNWNGLLKPNRNAPIGRLEIFWGCISPTHRPLQRNPEHDWRHKFNQHVLCFFFPPKLFSTKHQCECWSLTRPHWCVGPDNWAWRYPEQSVCSLLCQLPEPPTSAAAPRIASPLPFSALPAWREIHTHRCQTVQDGGNNTLNLWVGHQTVMFSLLAYLLLLV